MAGGWAYPAQHYCRQTYTYVYISHISSVLSDQYVFSKQLTVDFLQNMDYRLRFTVLEWSRIEWELTRERGLWGPDQPSPLDKWMLDTVEGPY